MTLLPSRRNRRTPEGAARWYAVAIYSEEGWGGSGAAERAARNALREAWNLVRDSRFANVLGADRYGPGPDDVAAAAVRARNEASATYTPPPQGRSTGRSR